MLFTTGLSKDFWVEEVHIAGYLINGSPHSRICCKTLEEMRSGNPTDYSNLRIFSCPAYAHVKTDKLEPRAVKCILVGYAFGVKGYMLWCTDQDSPRFIASMLHFMRMLYLKQKAGREDKSR